MTAQDISLRQLPADTTWRRLNHTPLRDLLRGRITAHWDVAREVAAADLPPLAGRLVYTVARASRLWPREQLEVARELAGHFRDGLDAGQPVEQLVERFGGLKPAIRLIRRARIRCRPRWWRILNRAAQWSLLLAAVFLAWFAWTAARFWIGQPSITRDFVAEINAPAQATPLEERSWPVYREAILALGDDSKGQAEQYNAVSGADSPADPAWPQLLEYLQARQEPLRLTRAGARRRVLGFVFGDPADADFMRQKAQRESIAPKPDECLIQLLLPHLQELRSLAHLLDLDARRAVWEQDDAALRQDLHALLSLADHIWSSDEFLIGDLVSLAVHRIASDRIARVLAERPTLLSDADLRDLSHHLASYTGGGDIRLRLSGERRTMLDFIQRMYTDDGDGDGRLTDEGYRLLYAFMPLTKIGENGAPPPWFDIHLLGPAAGELIAGRAEMSNRAMRLYDQAELEQAGPIYQWKPSEVEQELHRMWGSWRERIRYMPIGALFPGVRNAGFAGELACQRREGLLAALALELHHRRTGAWPATLAELTPALLPIPPMDRFTGEPLGYKIVDGRPLLYSRGADGQDNGGTPPPGDDPEKANYQWSVTVNPHEGRKVQAGYDWILFPPVPRPADQGQGRE